MCFGFKYEPGDFSFIKDSKFRTMVTHDYINCMDLIKQNNNTEGYFVESERKSLDNVWDTPPGSIWKKVSERCHQCHNEKTYNQSMKMLVYISLNGWEKMVNKFKLKFI